MTEEKKEFPATDEDLRLDRDLARQELGETVEALAQKLDVKTQLTTNVDEKLDQATAKVAGVVSPSAPERMRHGADFARSNPWQVFGALLALIVAVRFATHRKKH